jgi:hypothetical protein
MSANVPAEAFDDFCCVVEVDEFQRSVQLECSRSGDGEFIHDGRIRMRFRAPAVKGYSTPANTRRGTVTFLCSMAGVE